MRNAAADISLSSVSPALLRVILLSLFAFAFLLYANTISHSYNLDDELVTRDHRLTSHGISAIPGIFTSAYYVDEQGYEYDYRPVTLTSFAVEHQLFGESPHISHFINVLLYAVTVIILFLALQQFLMNFHYVVPLIATLLFIVHPLHTEVVASIKNRDEILSLLFGLCALFFMLRYYGENKYAAYGLAVLFFLLAVLSKRSIFSFALVIPLASVYFHPSSFTKLVISAAPLALITTFFAPMYGWLDKVLIFAGLLFIPLAFHAFRNEWHRVKVMARNAAIKLKLLVKEYVIEPVYRVEMAITGYTRRIHAKKEAWFRRVFKDNLYEREKRYAYSPITLESPWIMLLALVISSLSFFYGFSTNHHFFQVGPLWLFAGLFWLSGKRYSGITFFFLTACSLALGFSYDIPRLPNYLVVYTLIYFLYIPRVPLLFLLPSFIMGYILMHYYASHYYGELTQVFDFLGYLIPLLFIRIRKVRYIGLLMLAVGIFIQQDGFYEKVFAIGGWSDVLALVLDARYDFIINLGLLLFGISWIFAMPRLKHFAHWYFMIVLLLLVTVKSYKQFEHERQLHLEHLATIPPGPVINIPDSLLIAPPEPETAIDFLVRGRELEFVENPVIYADDRETAYATASWVMGYYLKMMVFPHPMRFYYGYKQVDAVTFGNIWAVVSLVAHVILLLIALAFVRKIPLVSFGILAYLASIVLFSNLFAAVAGMVGERLTYVATFGFCVVIAGIAASFTRADDRRLTNVLKRNTVITAILCLVLLAYSAKTFARNQLWKDHLTLFSHDIQYLENSAQAHNLLASHQMINSFEQPTPQAKKEMVNAALSNYKRAIEIYPHFMNYWFDLGRAYITIQDYQRAAVAFKKATELDPEFPDAPLYAGYALDDLGKPDEAIQYFEMAARRDPAMLEPYVNLDYIYVKKQDYRKAIEIDRRAMEAMPGEFAPYLLAGNNYMALGEYENAIHYFEAALQINNRDYNLLMSLAEAYHRIGNDQRAEYYYQQAQVVKR